MNLGWKQWIEKLKGLFARKRATGIVALPNQVASVRAGRFSLPIIDWDKIYRKSFLYNSIGAVICAFFVADLLILAALPYLPVPLPPRARPAAAQKRPTMSRYDQIFVRNLFNEKGLIPDADEGAGYDGPPVRTSLPLTLLGVIVTSDPTKSVASIEDKGSNQVYAVRETENMGAQVTIQKIEIDRVVFLNRSNERREFVELPKDQILATRRAAPAKPGAGASGIQQSGNHYTIDRKVVDELISPEKLPQVLTEARCVPHMEGGRSCYQCFQIVPGSIYDKLGIKDNDVICNINGQALDDPSKIFNFLTGLKDAKNIQISGNRGGRPWGVEYDIQ